jgi:hypothetical protein
MTEKTKSTNKLLVKDKNILENLIVTTHLKNIVNDFAETVESELKKNSKRWIPIYNKEYYYIPSDNLLIVDTNKMRLSNNSFLKLTDFNWRGMTSKVAEKWFVDLKDKNPLITDGLMEYTSIEMHPYSVEYIYCSDVEKRLYINGNGKYYFGGGVTDTGSIKIPIYFLTKSEREDIVSFLLQNNLNIFKQDKLKKQFDYISNWIRSGFLSCSKGECNLSIASDSGCQLLVCDMEKIGVLENIDRNKILSQMKKESFAFPQYIKDMMINELLSCDERRVNLEKYPAEILESPEFGHWDLWSDQEDGLYVTLDESIVARNPVYDALDNKRGVIGIDFGTKSTVVTYRQSRAEVFPMRIGSGKYSRKASQKDYENPTVMELRDVDRFMKDYNEFAGRPYTRWEDLLISHEAAEQLKSEQGSGDTFATFFSELKQWSSDKTRQVKLRDLKGKEVNIPAYLQLTSEDFDPIEIYAYYLGMFINNMLHKIYLRYKLSFPATVEKAVRDKLLESFTRGIKKSLPQQVLDDSECMKIFKVEQGASEPAAYAISALQEYGFEPEDDEKVYYGIFDFGGGTTDFDFGVWSNEEREPENYDYQISHFGQGGDPYLGGENLLGYMAYKVFLNNYNKLLEDSIIFIRPFGEKEEVGKDWLIKQDSQYAHFNHKRLMEKLRGVWEGDADCRAGMETGTIELPLFNKEGDLLQNYSLEVNLAELDDLIENRIEVGIEQFFSALKNCFGVEKNQKDIFDVEEINIFLAGNSSKSPVVINLFHKHIEALNGALSEHSGEKRNWVKIYPPLGTDTANAIIEGKVEPLADEIIKYQTSLKGDGDLVETVEEFDSKNIQRPTGKTGVAFGLLNNRVRVTQNEEEEIGFRYYIGQNRKNKFYCVIDKDKNSYGEWIRFCLATKEEFDIWFTRSAEAPTNKLPITQTGVHSEIGFVESPTDEKNVYIRLATPTDIEYIVASEDEIKNNSYSKNDITSVSLQER